MQQQCNVKSNDKNTDLWQAGRQSLKRKEQFADVPSGYNLMMRLVSLAVVKQTAPLKLS